MVIYMALKKAKKLKLIDIEPLKYSLRGSKFILTVFLSVTIVSMRKLKRNFLYAYL